MALAPRVISSGGGTSWTAKTPTTIDELRLLESTGVRLVAAGVAGEFWHSTDGDAWTMVTATPAERCNQLHFDGAKLWAACDNGVLLVSIDFGLTWSHDTLCVGIENEDFLDVVSNGDNDVAVLGRVLHKTLGTTGEISPRQVEFTYTNRVLSKTFAGSAWNQVVTGQENTNLIRPVLGAQQSSWVLGGGQYDASNNEIYFNVWANISGSWADVYAALAPYTYQARILNFGNSCIINTGKTFFGWNGAAFEVTGGDTNKVFTSEGVKDGTFYRFQIDLTDESETFLKSSDGIVWGALNEVSLNLITPAPNLSPDFNLDFYL